MSKNEFFTWMEKYRPQLFISVPLLVLLIALIFYIFGGRYVSTDDAYVKAAQVEISSNVPGQVVKIYVHDNQKVKKGEILFVLDDKPYKIAVDNAKAQLLNAELQIQALKATYQQQLAQVESAQDAVVYQKQELDRQKKLASDGISSQMQLNKAANSFANVNEQLIVAKQQLDNILASLDNNAEIPVQEHPLVQEAQAQLDRTNLNLSYLAIKAPMDGIITQVEQLQIGDYISTGTPVFALISNSDIWVEANFKETDMTYLQSGQKATITIDAYPNKKFVGYVTSSSPATASNFSLLPPENATGNWVKIVQRLPIRISIDNIKNLPFLNSGFSATVTVDTKHTRII